MSLNLPKLLRETGPADLDRLAGLRVVDVRRRGKMLLVSLTGDCYLLCHLKMTGQFVWALNGTPRDVHTHLRISFRRRKHELRFRDVRKFGFLRVCESPRPEDCGEIRSLGPEPLEIEEGAFRERLLRHKGRLKSLLLNQSFIAGIGNIYADEILFESRLHPLTPASTLTAKEAHQLWLAMREILGRAIAAGGSSIRDYKDADGLDGRFQFFHKAYGRKGLPCPRSCGGGVERLVIGGRASFFCPRCQKRKRQRRTSERENVLTFLTS